MSILSTNTRLIKVGQDYSAGSGISIDDGVISVTGEFGKTYSAGDNIDIYEQDEQLYISSKDWANDIANASANAYNEATAQIPDPFDPSYISGQIDNKLDSTAFTNWQDGQYATDLQTIEGQISNKLDTSSFSDVSASFLTAINIPESATWNEVSQAYEQASGTYLTSVSIPESAVWQDVSTTVQSNSAQWSDNTGDEEVNSFVYDNSATINDVNSSYQTNSGNFLTALPEDVVYTEDLTGYLSTSSTGSFQTKATISVASSGIGQFGRPSEYTFLTQNQLVFTSAIFPPAQVKVDAGSVNDWNSNYNTVTSNSSNWNDITAYQENSANFYPTSNPSGFISEIPDELNLSALNIEGEIRPGQSEKEGVIITQTGIKLYNDDDYSIVNIDTNYIENLDYTIHVLTSNSANWNEVSAKQPSGDYYSASNPSGFITVVDLSPYYTTADANTLSSMLSGAIDYVSANSSGSLTGDAQGAVDTVYNISGSIISGTRSDKNFTATNVNNITINNTTIGNNAIINDQAGVPERNWSIGYDYASLGNYVLLGPNFGHNYWQQYQRVYLDKTGLSSMSGTSNDKKLIWKAILNTDIEGNNNTITAINGSAIPVGNPEVNSFVESNSASLTEATNVVESNSAAWFDNVGDAEVNSFVYTNSATILDVDTTYQTNSASYLTAHQDISNKLDTTAFSTVSGDFLTTSFEIPESAAWDDSTYITQTNSSVWNNVTGKQDSLSFHYLEI